MKNCDEGRGEYLLDQLSKSWTKPIYINLFLKAMLELLREQRVESPTDFPGKILRAKGGLKKALICKLGL